MGKMYMRRRNTIEVLHLHLEPQNVRMLVCSKAMASVFCAAGIISIVFILRDPKVSVIIFCDMLC